MDAISTQLPSQRETLKSVHTGTVAVLTYRLRLPVLPPEEQPQAQRCEEEGNDAQYENGV